MPKVTVYNQSGEQVGELELSDAVFGIEPNQAVLHEAVVAQRAAERQGTHAVKNRSAVRGGGRKPWRQKGTGRARQGSIRSPQWVGGGVVFGPTPRNYGYKMPKKKRRLALKSALSGKVSEEAFIVLEGLQLEKPKTKDIIALLKHFDAQEKKALVVTGEQNENVFLSARNLPNVKVVSADKVNVYDVLYHDNLVITKDAVEKVEEVLGQ